MHLENRVLIIDDSHYDLSRIENVYVVGAGKAVLSMGLGVIEVLNNYHLKGTLITKHKKPELVSLLPEKIRIFQGAHPIPSGASVDAAKEIAAMLKESNEDDFVICLISGGGSSLMTLPHKHLGLEAIQSLTSALLISGADIEEINTIRKHVDRIKGGGMLELIWPSSSVTLILSDVIGDSLSMIASGPTVFDPTTFTDAYNVLKKYHLEEKIDSKILKHIREGCEGSIPETIKPGSKFLEKNINKVIGSLSIAADAAMDRAKELGFDVEIISTTMTGEAKEAGVYLGRILKKLVLSEKPVRKPTCFIAGGETTVTVHGDGKGGRNQELALSAAIEIDGLENCMLITLATDGEDGPTDAAGAIVMGDTLKKGGKFGLDAKQYLENNDSYHFFDRIGSLLRTGPTGTNVNDLAFLIVF